MVKELKFKRKRKRKYVNLRPPDKIVQGDIGKISLWKCGKCGKLSNCVQSDMLCVACKYGEYGKPQPPKDLVTLMNGVLGYRLVKGFNMLDVSYERDT